MELCSAFKTGKKYHPDFAQPPSKYNNEGPPCGEEFEFCKVEFSRFLIISSQGIVLLHRRQRYNLAIFAIVLFTGRQIVL